MTSSFQIVGDYYITAPTHKLAQMMSSRSVPVYLYNYEYQSKYAQWEGTYVERLSMGIVFSHSPETAYMWYA